jgi:hypothetical protein
MADVIALTGVLALNALLLLWFQRGVVRYAPARLADDAERLARQGRGALRSRRTADPRDRRMTFAGGRGP